ncbi:MAG: hypothetical protein WBD03_04425 [Thermoplasmata archaeon]
MRTRILRRAPRYVPERNMMSYRDHRTKLNFRPHCYVQSLALVESRRFDAAVALARASDFGEKL